MKTILICTSKFGNPISDYFKGIGEQFVKDGYKVIFIFDGLFYDYPDVDHAGFKFYTWESKRPTKFKDFVFFYQILRKEKPILCLSNFGSTNVVSLISYLLNIKFRINYIHTSIKQITIDSNYSIFKKYFLKYRKKIIYSLNTHLFTNSSGTKSDTAEYYNIRKDKILVFPLLVKESKNRINSFYERDYSICIVGRLNRSKGHAEFLILFSKCIEIYPDLKLKIAGDGFLKTELISIVQKLNIEHNVSFLGSIPNHNIDAVFSKSLISVSSSLEEAYGLVNIEALREGTPLLCTKTFGSTDIIEERYNGLFFDLNDVNTFLNSLNKILNDWDLYSLNSVNSFENRYSLKCIEEHYGRIIKILSKV